MSASFLKFQAVICVVVAQILWSSVAFARSGVAGPLGRMVNPSICESLQACVLKLETWDLDEDYSGHLPYEITRIGAKLAQYGAEATVRLIALLNHQSVEVRDRAALALGFRNVIHEKYLPALIRAHQNKVRNLPMPIMLTQQAEAVEYLLSHMRTWSETWEYGFSRALARFPQLTAVPMAEALSCDLPCSETMTSEIFFAFRFMDVVPMDVVPIFIRHLNNPSIPVYATWWTINIVGEMGERAGPITPDLVRLAWLDGNIGRAATEALLDLKHPLGVRPALKHLRKVGAIDGFVEKIVEQGPAAAQAAPAFVEMLSDHEPWRGAFVYAWALGAMGYEPAVRVLGEALDSPDWLVAYYAIEALTRLGAYQYMGKLILVADDHYAAPVRSAAKRNVTAMDGEFYPPEGVYGENENYLVTDILTIDHAQCGPGRIDTSGKVPRLIVDSALKRSPRSKRTIAPVPIGIPDPGDDRPVSAALKVPDGWLVGTNMGEWGGALYFIDHRGKKETILDANIFDIWRDRRGRIYFATGVDHLMYSRSASVWRLARNKGSKYVAERVLRLTDAPDQTIKARGDLVVVISDLSAVGLKRGKPVRVDCVLPDSGE